jgi:hypothetical protein
VVLISKHDEEQYRQYVIAQLRLVHMRVRLTLNEIEMIGKALKGKLIEPDAAVEWLQHIGALDYLLPVEDELPSTAVMSVPDAAAAIASVP